MIELNQKLVAEFLQSHHGVEIFAKGGGSTVGFEQLIKGECNIASASRPIQPSETRRLAQNYNALGLAHRIAKDVIYVYLHPANPVQDLSRAQLADIYAGTIKDWAEVGGNEGQITVYNQSSNSGTRSYLQTQLLEGREFGQNQAHRNNSTEMIDAIMADTLGIGFGRLPAASVRLCAIDGVSALPGLISDDYPLKRYLYWYTVRKPSGQTKQLIDWVMGPQGQTVIAESGYIPLWVDTQ